MYNLPALALLCIAQHSCLHQKCSFSRKAVPFPTVAYCRRNISALLQLIVHAPHLMDDKLIPISTIKSKTYQHQQQPFSVACNVDSSTKTAFPYQFCPDSLKDTAWEALKCCLCRLPKKTELVNKHYFDNFFLN